jgi:hypothetical protein
VRTGLVALALGGAILAASAAIAGAAARPVAAPGRVGIQLLSTAAQTRANPLARAYIADGLAPGARLARTVEISNTTGSSAVVSVYAAAASFDHSVFAIAPGRSQDELSGWTTVGQGLLHLPARSTAPDTVTVRVPAQASAGEQYAVVWAQMSEPSGSRGGVTLVNRVGIRMYVSIGRGGLPAARFEIGSLGGQRSPSGRPLVLANVRNNGQRTLAIVGDLTLADGPGGLRAGPFPVALGAALAPGDSEPLVVRLSSVVPRGPWRAELRLASGLLHETADATISFTSARSSAPEETPAAERRGPPEGAW